MCAASLISTQASTSIRTSPWAARMRNFSMPCAGRISVPLTLAWKRLPFSSSAITAPAAASCSNGACACNPTHGVQLACRTVGRIRRSDKAVGRHPTLPHALPQRCVLPQITISYFTSVRAGVESGQRIIAAEEPQVSLRVLAAVVASAVIPVHRFGDDFRSGLARSLAMGIHIVNHQINTAGVDAHLGGGTKELSQV